MVFRWIVLHCVFIELIFCVEGRKITGNSVIEVPMEIRAFVEEKLQKMKDEIVSSFSCERKHCVSANAEGKILRNIENLIFHIRMLQIDVKQLHFGKRILRANMKSMVQKQLDTVRLFLNKLSDDLYQLSSKVDAYDRMIMKNNDSTSSALTTEVTTTASTTTVTTTTVKPTTTLKPVKAFDGRVRLLGGQGRYEGRVEIYSKAAGQWGTVCDTNWDDNDATVICKMMGYTTGGRTENLSMFAKGTGMILFDNAQCTSKESLFRQCSPQKPSPVCSHNNDAAVVCTLDPEEVEDVRLANGDASSGRVEIRRGGTWGTICSDEWDNRDANVVCNMLGFLNGRAKIYGFYGPGSGQIWLSNVLCYGDEDTIAHCNHQGWGQINTAFCDHWSDAGVQCS
ncbi:hypothetical protein FSP39_000381 [Pinctada imbricata]|uniref:SRCR domain-containing protein n=1 Tax=Pinctada imbricata TaxID=66713 RepID=A0AA88YJW4_PINIB|nr:hypothetical protein FSP39_000381 [Pinctada imbricata]